MALLGSQLSGGQLCAPLRFDDDSFAAGVLASARLLVLSDDSRAGFLSRVVPNVGDAGDYRGTRESPAGEAPEGLTG